MDEIFQTRHNHRSRPWKKKKETGQKKRAGETLFTTRAVGRKTRQKERRSRTTLGGRRTIYIGLAGTAVGGPNCVQEAIKKVEHFSPATDRTGEEYPQADGLVVGEGEKGKTGPSFSPYCVGKGAREDFKPGSLGQNRLGLRRRKKTSKGTEKGHGHGAERRNQPINKVG